MIIIEAADTFTALIDAAIMWARIIGATLALVLCVVAFSVGPLVAPGIKAARNRLSARLPAEHAPQAPSVPQARKRRPTPSWAHEQPTRYEEAA